MGEVYAGLDETLKRRVALKVVRSDYRLSPTAKARFLREAQILSNLDHPNICRVYNYVEDEGQDWLVLELIEGLNLRAALDAGLSKAQRLAIAAQIAQVLVVTHAAGIVHRDLKPGNVMITAAGDVKVLDFGLARALPAGREDGGDEGGDFAAGEPDDAAEGLLPAADELMTQASANRLQTERGALLGTLAYMSPEQARGEPATTVSDLYSFGLLLQELFTGIPPFDASDDSSALLERARRGDVPPPKGIDADLTRLIQRLKSLAPSERPTAVDTLDRIRWVTAKPARRVRWLAVAAVLATAAFGGTKYSVDLARERTAAVAARQEADRRRTQAEDLIGFMIGDLRKKLETVGRLEILDEVGAKAMAYFAAVPETVLTDHELADRTAALYQIGDVRIAQGRMAEALAPLAQSLALARTLVERHPDDGKRLFDLAQSHFWVGFVEWRQHRLDAALVHFREYLRLAGRLVHLDPKNDDWRLELASANSNIGSVLEEQGDLAGALVQFEATLAIERNLLARRSGDGTLRRAVASSNNAVGAVLRAQGRLQESLAHHREELALQEELVRAEPANAQWRQYLSVSHNRVAMLLEATGEAGAAADHAAKALAIMENLAQEDPANVDWQRELARSHFRVGVVADARGEGAAALPHLLQAVEIMARAAALDAMNPARQRDLAEARAALAQHHLEQGDARAALAQAQDAGRIADLLLAREGGDGQAQRLRGLALVLEARAWTTLGERDRARGAWSRAVEVLEPVARGSHDYTILDPWARALAGLRRADEAKGVARQLAALGYRHPLFLRAIR